MRVLCKNYHHTVHNMVPIQMDSGKGTELEENNMYILDIFGKLYWSSKVLFAEKATKIDDIFTVSLTLNT